MHQRPSSGGTTHKVHALVHHDVEELGEQQRHEQGQYAQVELLAEQGQGNADLRRR